MRNVVSVSTSTKVVPRVVRYTTDLADDYPSLQKYVGLCTSFGLPLIHQSLSTVEKFISTIETNH